MTKRSYLITGASGEVGHSLITTIRKNQPDAEIITLDIVPLEQYFEREISGQIIGDILDMRLISQIFEKYEFDTIFHLASILSTKAEKSPELANKINVDGTINLLQAATQKSTDSCRNIKLIYPSSIAAFGIASLEEKNNAGKISEKAFLEPITMYGCNKLYCEKLGVYYANHYRQVESDIKRKYAVDFRCLRFPGLISAITVPSGGTSDYGPEMLHMAAQNIPYECFVRPDSTLPFMVMPDAVKSLLMLEAADIRQLKNSVYNVNSFSISAEQFYAVVHENFPISEISFVSVPGRQKIVDSWPADLDDSAARRDWGWNPDYDVERSFNEYLIPAIREKYHC